MRVLAMAALLCSCGSDHFGTYFIADGRPAAIDFDHAEFFFGSPIGGRFASPSGTRSGDVYQRLFVPNDEAVTASRNKTATYYLADDGATNVGSYVLVLARDATDAIVGVAEASDFPLATGSEVIEVQLTLAAPDNVENWGDRPSCVAWARGGGQTDVAVVREDDRDCDGASASKDCNDVAYCASGDPTCSTALSLCLGACALGCRANTTCEPSLCLPAAACPFNDACRTATSVQDRLDCIASQATQIKIALQDTGRPCVDAFVLPLPSGTHCSNPIIEYAETLPDRYAFEVTDGATSCEFSIKKPSNPDAFTGNHHLLVSIDPPSGVGPRPSLFIAVAGVQRVPVATCTDPVTVAGQLAINACQ